MPRFIFTILVAWAAQASGNVANASLRSPVESENGSRKLSYEPIANYIPQSKVTDHNAIDLDQMHLEEQLDKETASGFMDAKAIYREGGNSKSIALVNLLEDLPIDIPANEKFLAFAEDGDEINLTLYKNAEKGTKQLHLRYDTSTVQEYYNQCRIGGLQEKDMVTTGCVKGFANAKYKKNGGLYRYSYSITSGNYNARNLQYISKEAESKMLDCPKCPYKDALMFSKYYGQADYGDEWIMAAFDGKQTTFSNGNADFSNWAYSGRAECIKKGTVYMNVFMFVLREFEHGLDYCEDEDYDEAVSSWDKGVAYYTGSQEKENGMGKGYLLYDLADKRSANFKTCGLNGDQMTSKSQVNHEFLTLAKIGQALVVGGKCKEARKTKEAIADIMYVPLVQGTLRYAYKLSNARVEREEGEGAVFAAAVLPRIHAANPESAKIIYDNMRVGSKSTNFKAVKGAFESVYKNMNINCDQVGSIIENNGNYIQGGAPCQAAYEKRGDDEGVKDGSTVVLGAVLGSVSGVLFIGSVFAILFINHRRKQGPVLEPCQDDGDIGDRTID